MDGHYVARCAVCDAVLAKDERAAPWEIATAAALPDDVPPPNRRRALATAAVFGLVLVGGAALLGLVLAPEAMPLRGGATDARIAAIWHGAGHAGATTALGPATAPVDGGWPDRIVDPAAAPTGVNGPAQ